MAENESTLLAYLAPWIDETVATRALAYILDRSPASRQALDGLLRDGGISVAPINEVQTEVNGPGTGRVDIACNISGNVRPQVLIEVKFHADLTGNQPGRYLDWLLTDPEESVLLFVVPESRIKPLWPELKTRAERGGRNLVEVEAERRCMQVSGTGCHLMVVSWRTLLDSMAIRTKALGEPPGIEADIQQLSGLARRRNDEVVSPFTVDYLEFGPENLEDKDRRTLDLKAIVSDAVTKAVADGWMSIHGLRNSRPSSASPYGRYFTMSHTPQKLNRELWLGVSDERWKDSGTPLYLWFFDSGDLELLSGMGDQLPGGLDDGYIPIDLKPGVEMSQVVDDVVRQVKHISDLIKNAPATG